MPISDDLPVALARLGMLGPSPEVNIRPVLLRVAVDLFLQKQHHAPEDLRLFEAMVGPLIDDVDTATRRLLLDRLFDHPATPPGLLERLTDDESAIAAELYRHATLSHDDLLEAAESGPSRVAATIAERSDLSPTLVHALVRRPEARVAIALADNPVVAFTPADLQRLIVRARADRSLAERLAGRVADPLTVAPLFPLVSANRRRQMLDGLRRQDLGRRDWGRVELLEPATVTRLDQLALRGEWVAFDDVLCQAFGNLGRGLRPLLHEGAGDVLALALASLGVSGEIAARIFILGDPAIGRSVAAVRRLTELVRSLSPASARRMVEAMVGSGAAEPRRPAAPAADPAPRRSEPAPARRDLVEPPRRVRREA